MNYAYVWCPDDDEHPDGVTYHNHGLSIIDAFCAGEFCIENKGTTYIAHNAKGYDAQFIKEYLQRKGFAFNSIPDGTKLMQIVIPKLKIRIIDSANFIPAPLSEFPRMFGLAGARKGMYPYAFNTPENWDYVGPMPELSEFLPASRWGKEKPRRRPTISTLDRKRDDVKKFTHKRDEIMDWWHEKHDAQYTWDNFKELEAYCKNDVKILASGCMKFRTAFLMMTSTNRWSTEEKNVEYGVFLVCFALQGQKWLNIYSSSTTKELRSRTVEFEPCFGPLFFVP